MNSSLVLIVIGQIVVFQFAAVALTRSLITILLGQSHDSPGGESADYVRRISLRRFILGGLLLLPALATLIGFPADPVTRKLVLTIVSLTSSGAFAYASVTDRRAVRSMRKNLPEPGVRRASLQPRSFSHGYDPAWEILPISILLATVMVNAVLGHRLGHITGEMWVLMVLQAAVVTGALVYTFRHGIAVANVSSRIAAAQDRPDNALKFGERLAAREMQYFMLAKIGVTLLLGVSTVNIALEALNSPAAPLLSAAGTAILGLLVVLFAAFILQVVALTRSVQRRVQR